MGGGLVLLTWAMVASILLCVLSCARRWRIGGSAAVDWRAGLRALPRRYLVDVHGVVARRKPAARMHALVAGGLLAGSALLLLGVIPALRRSDMFWSAVVLSFLAGLAGTLMAARRRAGGVPAHLSGGRFLLLPIWLGCTMGGGAIAASMQIARQPAIFFPALAVAGIGAIGLVEMVRRGPLRHAVAGVVTLAAHPRPRRFGGGSDVALLPLDLAAAQLGCAVAADFSWNQLVSFDACIQCGRCEQACPAFAAGQRLNPKKLIQDLAGAMKGGAAMPYSGSAAPHIARPEPPRQGVIVGFDAAIHPDTLWACTTCRACVEECPMMIEHVDAVIDLRRNQTLMLGAAPDGARKLLHDTSHAAEPGGNALSRRTDFAAGLPLPVLGEGEETDILLWLGDGAFDLRYGRTLRALVRLMHQAGLRYAVLGEAETTCGDLARRLGDEATFQKCAAQVVETLGLRRFARIVTADPHALNVLRNEYPAFGGNWTVLHHTSLLDGLVSSGRLKLRARDRGPIAYHDPCYLGRYNGEFAAPRRLLDAACSGRVEMERHSRQAMCCGGGGGNPVSDIEADTRIPDLRMAQAASVGAGMVAVSCPGCTTMLEGVAGTRAEVRDIAELVLDALEPA